MESPSRREFLKTTGMGVIGLSMLETSPPAGAEPAEAAVEVTTIPPHRPLSVPGVHAYPVEHSIPAGGDLELCVSSCVPYRLSICRLGSTLDDRSGDAILEEMTAPARPQLIHPGSYVHVEKKLVGPLLGLTIECWVRPWSDGGSAGLITQHDGAMEGGFGAFLRPGGQVAFELRGGVANRADRSLSTPPGALERGLWHHIVATWDGREAALWVDGQRRSRMAMEGPVQSGSAPLRLAASGEQGAASNFLDGDLAMPALYGRALTDSEVESRFADRGLTPPGGVGLLACWPLREERGDHIVDGAGQGRYGRIINHATWMIGGPAFGADVPRFGDYEPENDPRRGHGLRFASDDLYDCRWPVTHRWKVPADAKSGLHVARFQFEQDGQPRTYHATFLVRRAPAQAKAKILVLTATNTWRAYSATPFAPTPPELTQVWGTGGMSKDAGGLPAYCLYRGHAAGQGTYQVGLRMPWPSAGPYVYYGAPAAYSHLMRAERFAHAWLEENGYEFDVVSDLDLHRDPELLEGYPVVVINGHSEYWSLPMYRGLEAYLGQGGRLVVLSGNSLFWRVSFDDAGTVMECRKADAPGTQVPLDRRGEAWHSQDGLRGGLMRDCGHPGWRLVGLDSLGWIKPSSAEHAGPYVVERADHPFFRSPEAVGLAPGDEFAWAGEGRLPVAGGHEFDVRPSTLAALQEKPSPKGGQVPPDPEGIVRIANGIIPWKKGGSAFDYFFRPIKPGSDQGGEMIDWRRPDGGRVFNAGTIGAGWALHADPRWAAVLRNVLHHFGIPRTKALS